MCIKKSLYKAVGAAVLSVLVAAGALSAQTPVEKHGRLKVVGSRILNQHDQPVQLRGPSLYWSISTAPATYYNADVVEYVAREWDATLIRAAMGVEDCWDGRQQQTGPASGNPCNTQQAGYLYRPDDNRSRVEAVVDGAIEHGIYVIIDWHSHMAHLYQDEAIEFFEYMANKYKDYPNVIYELYNEPTGTTVQTWANQMKPYQQAVVNAIRAIDPHNLIIIGTPSWCQRPDIAADDPVEGDNLVYSIHFYAASVGSTGVAHKEALRNRIMYSFNKGLAIFASEFGSANYDGGGAHNAAETDKWMAFFDEFGISWATWSLSHVNEAASLLRSAGGVTPRVTAPIDWSGHLTEWGEYVHNRLTNPPTTESLYYTLKINIVGEGRVSSSYRFAAPNPTEANPDGTIQATVNPALVFDRGANSEVTLIVTAAEGYNFTGWSGDLTETEARSIVMDGNKEITATFVLTSSSVLPTAAYNRAGHWSVRQVNGGLSLSGPSSGDVTFYDARGRQVRKFTYGAAGSTMVINNIKIPSGNFIMVVRDRATGSEVYRTRVSLVR